MAKHPNFIRHPHWTSLVKDWTTGQLHHQPLGQDRQDITRSSGRHAALMVNKDNTVDIAEPVTVMEL